jgi:hypothetical protein
LNVCEILSRRDIRDKIYEIAKESLKTGKEVAISICNGKIVKEIGDEMGVPVPQCPIGSPKVVIHTHTLTDQFSEADRRASFRQPVCLVYKNKIKCMYKGRERICQSCYLNQNCK